MSVWLQLGRIVTGGYLGLCVLGAGSLFTEGLLGDSSSKKYVWRMVGRAIRHIWQSSPH